MVLNFFDVILIPIQYWYCMDYWYICLFVTIRDKAGKPGVESNFPYNL